jgi:DNA-directed RNA polymerase alpha subunit
LNGKTLPVVSLAELDAIHVRNLNELDEEYAIYAHQLARFTKDELLALPNFGVKAVEQCRNALDAIGFEHPDWS